ncbi:MAG: phosphoribosyl-ATP diphosphatase [Sphingomonadaceae bacterium]|nr:phosphoribosyl-ATP diphosphatase [Sphingomonadaceae bacterium]
MPDTLARLEATIAARRDADPAASYVAALFTKGLPRIAQKLGEEAFETVIAAMDGSVQSIASEAADLLFHLMVLLSATGVPFEDVLAELDRREGKSGLEEKAERPKAPPPKPETAAAPLPSPASPAPPSRRPLIRKG